MAAFLDLPREIYLIITSLLSTADLINLASSSCDHYLAAQRPLYCNLRLGSYSALIKLIAALTSAPVVSHIGPRQRLFWHKLTETQRSDRQVERLDLTLDLRKDGDNVTGAVLAHCINTITRKCSDARISLTLLGVTTKLIAELRSFELPGVTHLAVFLRRSEQHPALNNSTDMENWPLGMDRLDSRLAKTNAIRALVFSGSCLPDLESVYVNSMVRSPSDIPSNLVDSLRLANGRDSGHRERGRHGSFVQPEAGGAMALKMRKVKLELNSLLDTGILDCFFSSNIGLSHLTNLEIVNCPSLHPIIDFQAIGAFLRRALPLLHFLKLHLVPHADGHYGYKIAYTTKIIDHPAHHICHIVRELGESIGGLDLAIPFACHHMFLGKQPVNTLDDTEKLQIPEIPPTPACTLPDRLMGAGYRYRRLIFLDFCSEGGEWEQMASLTSHQGERISWELIHNTGLTASSNGVWSVSGCLPVKLDVGSVMHRSFNE